MKVLSIGFFLLSLCSCAVLHKVAVDEIDNTHPNMTRFDLKVSEMGINLQEVGATADLARSSSGGANSSAGSQITSIIGLFQMGPHTGNIVFSPEFADKLLDELYVACPSGQATGITSVREMAKYPLISGEILKLSGWCIR